MTTPDQNQRNPDQPPSEPTWATTSSYPPPAAYPPEGYGPAPYGQAPYGQAPYGQAPYGQAPYGQAPYGQAPYGQAGYPPPGYQLPRNGLGTAGLVCGIIAVVFCWTFYGGWILGILAICFGGVGLGRAKRGEADNRGSAMAGVVLGIVAIVIPILLIVVGIGLFTSGVSTVTTSG